MLPAITRLRAANPRCKPGVAQLGRGPERESPKVGGPGTSEASEEGGENESVEIRTEASEKGGEKEGNGRGGWQKQECRG